jgi:predicted membrane chloride channel (bestrophin family)
LIFEDIPIVETRPLSAKSGIAQVAECEQIKCTPIPLSYSRHTSRFFTLFSVTLPFALIESTNPVLVPLITTGISWILFATEEIGHVIEEPFGQVQQIPQSLGLGFQPLRVPDILLPT